MKEYVRFIIGKYGGEVLKRDYIEDTLARLGVSSSKIYYMLSRKYILRTLRGYFYIRTFDEISRNTMPNIYHVISETMKQITKNWFFGLYTALMLTKLTHEYFTTYYVINDKLYRPKEIDIIGHKVRIIRFSKKLFGFGIINKNSIKYSDAERTILDMAYWMRYRLTPTDIIIGTLKHYCNNIDREKINTYIGHYPRSLRVIIDEIIG